MSKTYKLGDICTIGSSKRVHLSDYVNNGVPFFRSKEIIELANGQNISEPLYISNQQYDEIKRRFPVPKKNDILITSVGTIGVCYLVKDENFYFKDGNLTWLRDTNKNIVDIVYLIQWLKSKYFKRQILNNNIGAVQKAITIDYLKKVKITLPDLPTQQKIASVLSALDDKIELNNRINAELEAMAKTLYDYWFVQFDFPNEEAKPYKSSGGKMVSNETLKREIPEGWEVTVFNDWINDTKAGDWGKEAIEGNYTERVYCIRGADINGINGKGEVKAPERFILKNNSSKKLIPNDFVVEISGGSPVQSTGRIALITESTLERFDTDIICSNFCKAVSIKNEKYIYNFKQEWQRLYDAGVFFGFEGKTSGIKNFLFDSFMNSYSIVLPKKEIVEKYYEFAQSIDKKIQSNLKQNQELSALRDWLLPMLMNGQVKVGEIVENKEAKIVELNKSQIVKPGDFKECFTDKDKKVCRKMLATFIINESLNDQSFGKTKFEKLLHLVEYHLVKGDFNQSYTVQAAGPYDGAFTKTFWSEVLKGEWFKIEELGSLKRIKTGKNHIKSLKDYGYFSESLKESVRGFVHKFSNSNYEQPEIISTLFAVWNNRIIRKEIITDELIKEDFLNWDLGKGKYANRLDKALDWMRKEGIIPNGWGKEIKRPKKNK